MGAPQKRVKPARGTDIPSPNERQAFLGSEGVPNYHNRYITESDITRQLDAILTQNHEVLTDQDGNVLYG